MEYSEGTPLQGPLPMATPIEYAGQVLDALDAALKRGFTRRDLQPANIPVRKLGIEQLDFGPAKQSAPLRATDATLTAALLQNGQILQSMASEQLQGKEADARSRRR
jgi:hypothetical protein